MSLAGAFAGCGATGVSTTGCGTGVATGTGAGADVDTGSLKAWVLFDRLSPDLSL